MYNKLFTKILDSSIWLEPNPTRIVWITLIAAMDEDGFCAFASPANLSNRALVPLHQCKKAIAALESPDKDSGDPDNDGRRIERVPGGWIVLNAVKYKEIVSSHESRRLHRERQQRYRMKRDGVTFGDAQVTPRDAVVTVRDARVTPHAVSVTQSETETETETVRKGDPLGDRDQSKIEDLACADRARAHENVNPHSKPTNLVNGHELRRHGTHAFCGRVCVAFSQHEEFKGQGLKTDDEMKQFYRDTLAKFEGQPIGDEMFTFWRSHFAVWVGIVSTKPRALTPLQAMGQKLKAEKRQ